MSPFIYECVVCSKAPIHGLSKALIRTDPDMCHFTVLVDQRNCEKNHLLTETSEQLTCRSGLILGKKSISEYKINEVYQFNQILAIILPTPLPVAFPESLR
jgi:hypothetical protein